MSSMPPIQINGATYVRKFRQGQYTGEIIQLDRNNKPIIGTEIQVESYIPSDIERNRPKFPSELSAGQSIPLGNYRQDFYYDNTKGNKYSYESGQWPGKKVSTPKPTTTTLAQNTPEKTTPQPAQPTQKMEIIRYQDGKVRLENASEKIVQKEPPTSSGTSSSDKKEEPPVLSVVRSNGKILLTNRD